MPDSVTPISAALMNSDCLDAANRIAATSQRLRHLTQLDVQPQWRYYLADMPVAAAPQAASWQDWSEVKLNHRHHIAWPRGQQVMWLGQTLTVPTDLDGYPLQGLLLRLSLTWWADQATIFMNGRPVQEGDLFDCSARILLSPDVAPGDSIDVALRLVSPGHDDGALVQSRCIYERPASDAISQPEPGFVADELEVLQHYLTALAPDQLPQVAAILTQIDWATLPQAKAFDQGLTMVRQRLQPWGNWLKQHQIQLLGHAHLDLAWLWPIAETWEAAERTFKSVLQLQAEFPELIFCHSTPALYAWMEEHRPDLFAAIQQQIARGPWEVVAGLWVEPEFNLVSGESIARQVLYGQNYVQQRFGQYNQVAWLPDSFGFCWQLPQILKQGGVNYFVTQKLRWNDTTQFPHDAFWWRSPDGSQIFSLTAPPIGTQVDPVKMAEYACQWETSTGHPATLWLPGVGDHGGGPTRDMLEVARRWQQSPLFPKLQFTSALNYLQCLKQTEPKVNPEPSPGSESGFPVWNDELYLEFHRGCYTTHADQKRWNRRCEVLLYQAELFSSMATLLTGTAYPQAELETAWKQVLFNQFHDILPGSSIPEVFAEVNPTWQAAQHTGERLVQIALEAIAPHITLPPPPNPNSHPILLFNSLNWERSEVVAVPIPMEPGAEMEWQILDETGTSLPCQRCGPEAANNQPPQIRFCASSIPGIGYRLFWLSPSPVEAASSPALDPQAWTMDNGLLQVTIDPATGEIASLFDKVHQRQVLRGPGNQLQAFRDQGQYWDAWNIDPAYGQYPLPAAQLQSIAWVERGAVESRLRVVRQLGQSVFYQDYVLQAGSAGLKIITQVDWQERQTVVKAAFPLSVTADQATYEIPYGAMQRPTRPSTPAEQAKWEVPALHWAEVGDGSYGVSLLNDCKYGYDYQPDQIRLTLLRGTVWPDPEADLGWHQFTYVLYPHSGTWQEADVVRRGYELNQSLQVLPGPAPLPDAAPTLPSSGQFLSVSSGNLVVTALKQAEANPQTWILRCYECHGHSAQLTLNPASSLIVIKTGGSLTVQPTDLLERPLEEPGIALSLGASQELKRAIAPWKITTLALTQTS